MPRRDTARQFEVGRCSSTAGSLTTLLLDVAHWGALSVLYDQEFYAGQVGRSRESAAVIVPLIQQAVGARSMVDVGCGVGSWPLAFLKHGCGVAHGIDGPWVTESDLPAGSFFQFDFEKAATPFAPPLPRHRYDLVTSFEFVEHVDEALSEPLIDLFCRLSDIVIVGGAIPHQGGQHHVNERWPGYWAEKFRHRGYEPCDFIRPQVWNANVEPWYAQNPVAYFKGSAPAELKDAAARAWATPLALVHPEMWERLVMANPPRPARLRDRIAALPRRVAGKVKRTLLGSR